MDQVFFICIGVSGKLKIYGVGALRLRVVL